MKPLFLALALTAALARPAAADPTIVISDAWSRATVAQAGDGVVYLTIANHGTADDRVVGAATPVATKAELHTTLDDHGVMKMRPLADLPVKAGKTAAFKPAGAHIMLIGLKQRLKVGDDFPLTLTFAKAGPVETHVMVMKQPPEATKSARPMNMPGM
jgi:hypothetical protein